MRLTGSGAVPYSDRERETFALLSRRRRTTSELVDLLYRGKRAPFHARVTLNSILRSLRMKIEANGEPFRLERSGRKGPHPAEHWLEKTS